MSFAPLRYFFVLLAALVALAGITILPGALRVTGHEIDLIQTLDISYRMLEGDRPHEDFMTPLGVLSFLPIIAFLDQGYGPGMSFLLSQVLVTAILLPGIWWMGVSRLEGWPRTIYGVAMVLLGTSLIFGGDNPSITTAMFYNRWAWILASFVILLVFLRPRAGWNAPVIDGALLGLAGAALVLIKVTYVLGLAPVVLVWLAQERAGKTFATALAVFADDLIDVSGHNPGSLRA